MQSTLTLESVLQSSNKQIALDDEDEEDDLTTDDEKGRKNLNLDNDDLYIEFSSRSHDIGEYLQNAVNNPSESLNKLKHSLNRIDHYIRNEVVSQHDSLLSQSDDVAKLESDLKLIRDRVYMIENHMHRIRNGIITPFHEFKKKSKQSLNLQLGESYLRSILRIKKLLVQLNEYFHKNKDMVKSALCISEIMLQINKPEVQLSGVHIIDAKRDYIYSVYQQIGDLGKQKLSSGLRSLNQPNIAIGLQVFYNLGPEKLNNIIKTILQTSMEQCRENLKKALNVDQSMEQTRKEQAATDSKLENDGNMANSGNVRGDDGSENNPSLSVKSSLLIRLDKCVNHHLFGNLLQIWNLEKVLRKKNDNLSRPYIELVSKEFHSTLTFWASLMEIIKEELESAADSSSFINNVLMNEYPRLYQMLIDFYHKVESTTSNYDQTLPPNQQALLTKISGKQHRENLLASIGKFQQLFLDKCIQRIKQPLNILFGNREIRRIPTVADMRTLWTTFYNELKITADTPSLQISIANMIYLNGIKQMIVHLKKKIISVSYKEDDDDNNSSQLVDFRHNADIYNSIHALYLHISSCAQQTQDKKIKLALDANAHLHKSCNLLYNFNCYLLYYCLRVLWFAIVPSLKSMKLLSVHIQFVAHSFLPLVQTGNAMDYVLRQWASCLTMVYLQFVSLHFNICDEDSVQTIASNLAQFIKLLRIFEDEYNVDVVPAILMLQQYKRMLMQVNEESEKHEKTIELLHKEHPNLSLYLICQFLLAWIYRMEHKSSFTASIGMSVDEFVKNAFIQKHFFSIFEFNLNNNTQVAAQMVSVDIMSMTDEQRNLLQIIASKLKQSQNKYVMEIQDLLERT